MGTEEGLGVIRFVRVLLAGGTGSYLLLPVLTTAQRDALSAVAGMAIYNSTTGQVEEYNGSTWRSVGQAILTTHAADLSAHIYEFNTLGLIGAYFRAMPIQLYDNQTFIANKWYVHPFWVPRDKTIDRLAIEVTSGGGASKVARLVIYNDNGSVYPGTLLKDAGTVAVDAVAVVAATISQALTKGLYWLGVASDGTPTIAGGRSTQSPLGDASGGFTAAYAPNGYTYAAANILAIDPFPASQSPVGGTTPLVFPRLLTLD